jgi:hypothetical protein
MRIDEMRPEVEDQLRKLAEADQKPDTKPIDEVITDYLANGEHDEWTVQTARRIFEEDAEFFEMLGDR